MEHEQVPEVDMRVTDPRQKFKHRGFIRYTTESEEPVDINVNAIDTTTTNTPVETRHEVSVVPPRRRKTRGTKLPYGQKSKDIRRALRQLATGWSEARTLSLTKTIRPRDVWDTFTVAQKGQWQRAFGNKQGAVSAIASALWSIADGGPRKGEVTVRRGESMGKWTLTFEEYPSTTVTGNVGPHATTMPNGLAHLTVIGEDVNGNTLYIDPTSNIIGTVQFIPVGRSRA